MSLFFFASRFFELFELILTPSYIYLLLSSPIFFLVEGRSHIFDVIKVNMFGVKQSRLLVVEHPEPGSSVSISFFFCFSYEKIFYFYFFSLFILTITSFYLHSYIYIPFISTNRCLVRSRLLQIQTR